MAVAPQDPLKIINRISNPLAVSLFKKEGKRILLLGDIHTLGNECPNCKKPKCLDYITILKELDSYHRATSTQLDVFIEAFAPDYPEKLSSRLYEYGAWKANSVYRSLTGFHIDLTKLRKDVLTKLYFHEKEGEQQRYHYFDLRLTQLFKDFGFGVDRLLAIDGASSREMFDTLLDNFYKDMRERYPTKKALVDTLKDFLFGKPFNPSYKRRDLLSHGMTRIAKQFYKLDSRSEKALVRSFALSRINEILTPDSLKYPVQMYEAIFDLLMLLVDVYAICRFIRFFYRQDAGSTSVFLAGAFHTSNYAAFLKLWGARKIFSNQKSRLEYKYKDVSKKCVKVKFAGGAVESHCPHCSS